MARKRKTKTDGPHDSVANVLDNSNRNCTFSKKNNEYKCDMKNSNTITLQKLDNSDNGKCADSNVENSNRLLGEESIIKNRRDEICNSVLENSKFSPVLFSFEDYCLDQNRNYAECQRLKLRSCRKLGAFTIYVLRMKNRDKLRKLHQFALKPPFSAKKSEYISNRSFWKTFETKLISDRTSDEDIRTEINVSICRLVKHFKRLKNAKPLDVTHQRKPSLGTNFIGLYLPTVEDLSIVSKLEITVDPELDQWPQQTRLHTLYFGRHYSEHQKLGRFSARESENMMKNWEQFQKEYKIYDLRLLLGINCYIVEGIPEKFSYSRVQYLSQEQFVAFLKYLARGLHKRSLYHIWHHAVVLYCRSIRLGQCVKFSLQELHKIDYIINNYGVCPQLLNILVPSKTFLEHHSMLYSFYSYRFYPIQNGEWSIGEVIRLLDGIVHSGGTVVSLAQRTSLPGIYDCGVNWRKVSDFVQTRTSLMCCKQFHSFIKQALKFRYFTDNKPNSSLGLAVAEQDKKDGKQANIVYWTSKHELLLMKEMCKSSCDHILRVDFYRIAQLKEFKSFCDDFLRRMGREILKRCVPLNKRKYFDEALDYIAHEVIPRLEEKLQDHNENYTKRISSKYTKMLQLFPEYVGKYALKVFQELPLQEMDEQIDQGSIGENIGNPLEKAQLQNRPLQINAHELNKNIPRNIFEGSNGKKRKLTADTQQVQQKRKRMMHEIGSVSYHRWCKKRNRADSATSNSEVAENMVELITLSGGEEDEINVQY